MGLEAYNRLRKLGQGSFGSVFLVTRKSDSKQFVMKDVDLSKMGCDPLTYISRRTRILFFYRTLLH